MIQAGSLCKTCQDSKKLAGENASLKARLDEVEKQQRIAENLGNFIPLLTMETFTKNECMKIANAAVRQILKKGMSDNVSSKDLLDWIKYAREECEGTKSRKRSNVINNFQK